MAQPRLLLIRYAPWMIFQNNHPHDLMWPCSMLYAKGIAEKMGWKVDLLDLHVEPLDADGIVARAGLARYDLILSDTMTPTMAFAREVAARLRESQPQARVWGVGQHATEATDDLIYTGTPYDGVLLGEYEACLPDLLDNGGHSWVNGSAVLGDQGALVRHGDKMKVEDPDALPPISPDGLKMDLYRMRSVAIPTFQRLRWGNLLTSRGCPYPCTFCSATLRQSYGRGYRPHSAERVVDDMARLYTDYGVNAYYMIDDVFSLKRQRVVDICNGLIARKLPIHWTIQTRGDLIDKDLCVLLRQAGCTGVKMGVESGVPRILKIIRKNSTPQQMLQAAEATREAGLSLTAYYMIGHPTETREEMEETFRFARQIGSDMIQLAFHTPYPGSQSYEDFKDRVKDTSELNHYETQHVNPSEVDSETLEKMQREFYLSYYFSPEILWKYFRHRLMYRMADPGEWKLAAMSLRYLLLDRGRVGTSAQAPRPTMANAK